jgi:1-deoxy-D-xylulose-5-phosphate reductoisomerase
VFNAANEVAVEAFLHHRIPFGRITETVRWAMATIPAAPVRALADVLAADQAAREAVLPPLDVAAMAVVRPAAKASMHR